MATIPPSNKDIVEELVALQEHLNSWEVEFVKSLRGLLSRGYSLTEKQSAKLKAIAHNVAERME